MLQMEALRTEALRAERDLQDQNHKHQKELRCLREESLEVGGGWVLDRTQIQTIFKSIFLFESLIWQ